MARALLAGEFDLAAGRATDVFVKLEVQNGSGTWKNVATVIGGECNIAVQQGEHIDTKVGQATFTLIQKLGSVSLAPLIEASAANVDDAAAYSPLLDIGRLIRCSTATMGHGVTLDTGTYREIFTGRIDDVILSDQVSAWAGPIQLQCSDLGGWLMDLQIETPDVQYGDEDTPPNLEDVLQAVIDDNLPVGDPAVTVVKTSSSNFAVTDYIQGETKVMEGLTTLVLDSVGEDIRYRYNASHVSTLQWIDPDRSRVTIDGTFTKRQYLLRKLSLSLADIRNAGAMAFTDVASGVTGVVQAESLGSIDKYRRRFFRIPGSSMLTTRAESQAVINRVVNDLEAPPAEAEAELAYCWFVQLYDRYTFAANDRQYDQDQTFSVVGYQHSIESNRASTTLTLTARVVGAYKEWLKRIRIGGAVFQTASINRVSSTESTDGTTRDFTITIGARVDAVHLHYRTVPVGVVGDPLDFSGNETVTEAVTTVILPRVPTSDQITFSIPLPSKGFRVAARLIPYTVGLPDPIEGASWPFYVEPAGDQALAVRARVIASTTTSVTVRVAVADPYPQGAGSVTITYTETGGAGTACSPASGGTVTPEETLTEAVGTYIDYTITRPSFLTGTRRVTFTATTTDRQSASDAIDVPAEEGPGPVMDVVGTPGTTQFTITYTATTGTFEYSVDGAAYTSVPASPFNVSRNAAGGADKVLTFRCTRNSQTTTSMITVPAQVSTGATPQVNNLRVSSIDNTANEIVLAWDSYNIPVGATFNLEWSLGGTYFGQGSVDTTITGITSPYTHNDTGTGGHGLDLVLGGTTENIFYVIRVDVGGNPVAYSDPFTYLTDHV